MAPIYGRNAFGAIIMFDIASKSSFNSILEWKSKLTDEIPIVVVGNKCDLEDRREVSYEETHNFCENNGFEYWECSAATGKNVPDSFNSLLLSCFNFRLQIEKNQPPNAILTEEKQGRACC